MLICQAIGCYNTKGKHPRGSHQFPDPNLNKKQASLWLHNIGAGYTLQTFTFDNSKFLCGEHFHPDCYVKESRAKLLGYISQQLFQLKPGALPTIFKNKLYDIINVNGEKRIIKVSHQLTNVTMPLTTHTNVQNKKMEEKNLKKMKQSTLSFVSKDKHIMPTFVKVNKDANDITNVTNKSVPVKDITITPPKKESLVTSTNGLSPKKIVVVDKNMSKTFSSTSITNGDLKKAVKTMSANRNYVNSKKLLTKKPTPKKKIVAIESDSDDENDVPLSVLRKKLIPQKKQNSIAAPTTSAAGKSPVKSFPASPIQLTSASIQKLLPNLKGMKIPNQAMLSKQFTVTGKPGNQAFFSKFTVSGNTIQPKIGTLPQNAFASKPLITGSLTNPANLAAKIGSLPVQRPMKPIIIMPTKQMNIVPPKNIVIAIDMDPQQWRRLPIEHQRRIIEEKKLQAHQKYIAVALKNVPNAGQTLQSTIHTLSAASHKKVLSPLKPPKMPSGISNTIMSAVSPGTTSLLSTQKNTYILPNSNNSSNNSNNINKPTNHYIGGGGSFTDLISEKRYELDLNNLKPLPRPKKIKLPPEMKGKHFGDVSMIIEFVNTFKKFLMVEEDFTFTAKKLIYGLTCQKETETISKILLYFLKVLLGNENFKIKGLKMELADLPLTEFTVSFLVEQFLKSHQEKRKKLKRAEEIAAAAAKMLEEDVTNDDVLSALGEDSDYVDDGVDDDDDDDDDEWKSRKKKTKSKQSCKGKKEEPSQDEKLQTISRYLEKNEFHKMSPEDQLEVLTFLMHLINESEDLVGYHDELSQQKSEAYKNLDHYRRLKREEKLVAFAKQNEEKKLTVDNNMKMDNFTTKLPNAAQLTAGVATAKQAVLHMKSSDLQQEESKTKDDNSKQLKSPDGTGKKDSEDVKKGEKVDERDHKSNSSNNTNNTTDNNTNKETNNINGNKDSEVKKGDNKEDPYAGMTQRQIQVLKLEAKKLEEKKSEEHRLVVEKEKEELKALTQKFDEMSDLCKRAVRLEPLGFDRFSRCYWMFSDGIPGLYVSSYDEWFVFDDLKAVDELINALTILGIREDKLKRQLRIRYKDIKDNVKQYVEEFYGSDNDAPANTSSKTTNITDSSTKNNSKISSPSQPIDNSNTSSTSIISSGVGNNSPNSVTTGSPKILNSAQAAKETAAVPTGVEATAVKQNDNSPAKQENNSSVKQEDGNSVKRDGDSSVKEDNDTNKLTTLNTPNTSTVKVESSGTASSSSSPVIDLLKKEDNVKPVSSDDKATTAKANGEPPSTDKKEETKPNDKKEDASKPDPSTDHLPSSVEALKMDMFESSERIVQGHLGKFTNYEEWTAKLTSANSIEELKEHVLAIQKSIFEKSFLYPFKGFDPVFTTEWCRAVQKADTMSKLHTMYGILENSISWEKSSESLRCKACRRKQGVRNSTPMVICDACQNPYHMNCVRPALTEIPQSVWRCPKCIPKDSSYSANNHRSVNMTQGERSDLEMQSTEEYAQSDHEDLCHVCASDGLMILCDTCPLSFHFKCHDPPLRRAPKGAWSCYECRKGNQKKHLKKKHQKNKKPGSDTDDDEEDSGNNSVESDLDDFQHNQQSNNKQHSSKSKAVARGGGTNTNSEGRKRKRVNYDENASDYNNDTDATKSDCDSSSDVGGGGRRAGNNNSKKNKNNSKKSKQNSTSPPSSSGDGLLKVVLKKKKKTTSSSSLDKNDNDDALDSKDVWESTSRTPAAASALSLGNKRPCYAKDGVTHGSKSLLSSKDNRLSSENSDTELSSKQPPRKVTRTSGNSDTSAQRNSRTSRSSRRESNYELKACRNILVELRNHPDAELFQNPVNRREFPGYYSIIEQPMNIATIMKRLDSLQYDDVISFVDDVKLIFSNCEKYYKDSNCEIAECGVRLSQVFNTLLQQHLPGMAS